MLIAIIAISYTIAINVFGFRIVKIQRADRNKNGVPTRHGREKPLAIVGKSKKSTPQDCKVVGGKEKPEVVEGGEKTNITSSKHSKQEEKASEIFWNEEKLNFRNPERVTDFKILAVALFGGAVGEFVCFLVLKYRTTNTLLMVALPVLISLWAYILYILVSRIFII